MKIVIRTGTQEEVRNFQVGDWSFDKDGTLNVLVREMSDIRSMFAVAIHEAVEALLCHEKGISDEAVCAHDQLFETERREGKHDFYAEPGDDERAIYRVPHQHATAVEMCVCKALDMPWENHEEIVKEVEV